MPQKLFLYLTKDKIRLLTDNFHRRYVCSLHICNFFVYGEHELALSN